MRDFKHAVAGLLSGITVTSSTPPAAEALPVSDLAKTYGTVPADTMKSDYFKIRAGAHCVLTEDAGGNIGAKIFSGVTHSVNRNGRGRPIINADENIGGRVTAETDSLTLRHFEYSGGVRMYALRPEPGYRTPAELRQAGDRYTEESRQLRADTIRHYMGDQPLSDSLLIAEAGAMEFRIVSKPGGVKECSYLGGTYTAPLVAAPGPIDNALGKIGAAVDWRPSGF